MYSLLPISPPPPLPRDALSKIYFRKIKRSKKKGAGGGGDDYDSEEEEEDEGGEEDMDDDDDGGEEVCPPGCDPMLYEKVGRQADS